MITPKEFRLAIVLIFLVGISLFVSPAAAQNPNKTLSVEWQNYLPGISGSSVIQTSDGGYLALGQNASIDPAGGFTNFTSVVVKIDSSGNLTWTKTYSEPVLTYAIQVSDGYILAGTGLIKIDQLGNIVWERNYESLTSNISWVVAAGPPEAIDAITQTNDGGFALVATANTENSYGLPGFWVMKVDSQGNLLWIKGSSATSPLFPDTALPFFGIPCSIFTTADQGFVIVNTESIHAYVSTPLQMFKLDSSGNLKWNQTYSWHTESPQSSIYTMYAKSSIPLTDGYLIAGGVNSEAGLILKTDLQGNLLWNRTYSYSGYESTITSISEDDEGFLFLGTASPNPVRETTLTWLAKVDDSGQVQEQLAIPMGNHESYPSSLIQANDGGHVFVGVWNQTTTASLNQRFWIAKVSEQPTISQPSPFVASYWLLLTIILVAVTVIILVAVIAWKRKQHARR